MKYLHKQLLGSSPKCKFLAYLTSKESESTFAAREPALTLLPQSKLQSERYWSEKLAPEIKTY